MVPTARIELVTSSLPWKRSTFWAIWALVKLEISNMQFLGKQKIAILFK